MLNFTDCIHTLWQALFSVFLASVPIHREVEHAQGPVSSTASIWAVCTVHSEKV